jgi:hypothetical protein
MGEGAGQVSYQQGADGQAQDPKVEGLVEDIEETRNEMTGTVEEIGDRLDPRNIVADAKETVRSATVGKVEDMANTAGAIADDATQTARDIGGGLIDTITRNPIPAAMVGLGLGWLAMSGRSSSDRSQHRNGNQSRGQGQDALAKAQRQVGAVADDVAGKVGQLADEVPYQVRTATDDLALNASRMYDSNPLAIGAIAVAVGAAVGLAMPPTEVERRALAQPARQALGKAEEVATDALEQVEQQARDVEQQAREEDLQARPH